MLYSWTTVFEAICPFLATTLMCEGTTAMGETCHTLLTRPMAKLSTYQRQPFQLFLGPSQTNPLTEIERVRERMKNEI